MMLEGVVDVYSAAGFMRYPVIFRTSEWNDKIPSSESIFSNSHVNLRHSTFELPVAIGKQKSIYTRTSLTTTQTLTNQSFGIIALQQQTLPKPLQPPPSPLAAPSDNHPSSNLLPFPQLRLFEKYPPAHIQRLRPRLHLLPQRQFLQHERNDG